MKTQGSLLLIALFFAACYVSAQDVVVTQEIAAGSESGVSSENAVIVASVGNSLVWRDDRGEDITYFTNGSDYTTKDIFEGMGETFTYEGVQIGDLLYINVKFEDTDDHSIYAIDEEGVATVILSGYESVFHLTVFNERLYFEGEESNFSNAITRYDPATGLTEILFGVDFFGVDDIEVFQDRLFILTRLSDGLNLIASDGESSDYEVIYLLHDQSDFTSWQNMTATDDYLYFFSTDTEVSYGLYVTDGTTAGTIRLSTDFEQIPFHNYTIEKSVIGYKNKMFFRGRNATTNREDLYVASGADGSVDMITVVSGEESEPEFFAILDDVLYVRCRRGSFSPNQAMYRLSSFSLTAVEAIDRDDVGGGFALAGRQMDVHDGQIFFYGFDSANGSELWSTSGDAASTQFINDINPGLDGSRIEQLFSASENLYFFAETPDTGKELFVFNKDLVGTTQIGITPEFQIRPNVCQDVFTIKNNSKANTDFMIYDGQGQLLLTTNITSQTVKQVNVNHLPSGYYFVRMKGSNSVVRLLKVGN